MVARGITLALMVLLTGCGAKQNARLVFEKVRMGEKSTVVFVHGAGGSASQFKGIADALGDRVNVGAFEYDDSERLAASAETLRRELVGLRNMVVVAHSLGALLLLYAGVTDGMGELQCLGAVYLNPLIGGSHYADDIPGLWWLRSLKPFVQQTFFEASARDLAPENEFQQSVFGLDAPTPSFRARSVVILTERVGEELGVLPERLSLFFGRTRAELLERIGEVVHEPGRGHNAPLQQPWLTVPVIDELLNAPACRG